MAFENQSAKGPSGTWVCRNGGSIAFGKSQYEAEQNVLGPGSFSKHFFMSDQWDALEELFRLGRGL